MKAGITLGDAMRASGLAPGRLDTCRIEPAAMLELHIEQGSVLEESSCTVGAVEGIAGLERYTVRIEGCSAHAGATPMGARRDPVPAMSRWILKVTELARQRENCVATVGCVEVRPRRLQHHLPERRVFPGYPERAGTGTSVRSWRR